MIRTHWFDLILVLLPLLRPLRAFRLLRLLRVVAGSGRAVQALRRIDNRPGFRGFFGLAAVVVILGGYLVYVAEHTHPESNIDTAGEGVWWAIVTSTTVGYGDFYPITVEGRAVAGILMFVGIAILSVVTASIAAYFVENDEDEEQRRIEAKLDALHERFDRLEAALANGSNGVVESAVGESAVDAPVDEPRRSSDG
jgi:voltage-gated potassium channel